MDKSVNSNPLASMRERFMLVLTLIFVAILILPYAHPISKTTDFYLNLASYLIWAIFLLDYFWNLLKSKNRKKFFKDNIFELMIVILPFFRPLRLLRLVPVVAYFLKAMKNSLAERMLQYVGISAVLISAPAAVVVQHLESKTKGSNIHTLGDSLWWILTTITTVGYGDRYPVSTGGKIIAFIIMLLGISLVGIITASVASWFVKTDSQEKQDDKLDLIYKEIQDIKNKLQK